MSWIRTFSGRQFYPIDPRPEDIHIEDIAHALSNQCRFAGHLSHFVSVAQHCLLVASLVPRKLKLTALLHDAAEAYLVDLPRPIKRSMPQYIEAEEVLARMIALRFGAKWPLPEAVKRADDIALVTEATHHLPARTVGWEYPNPMPGSLPADAQFVSSLPPATARYLFLRSFYEFTDRSTHPNRIFSGDGDQSTPPLLHRRD